MNTKICTHCNNSFPETSEHFNYKGRFNKTLRSICKNCEKSYRDANKEHRQEIDKRWREENKDRKASKQSEYYKQNKEKENARYYKWKSNNLNKITDYIRKYIATHKEHKKEYDKEHSKIYRVEHKEEKKASTRNRRAKIKQAQGSHTAADIDRQYEAQRGKCYWCGAKVGDKYHVDHVIPITRGGSNDASNLVISCPTCNMSKSARLPHEWSNKLL